MPKLKQPLSAQQQKFINEYLKTPVATVAAVAAGYGKTRGSAAVAGHDLLKNEAVRAELSKRQGEIAERVNIDAAWVLREAVELHKRCMAKGEDFDSVGAARALKIIGDHIAVSAFDKPTQGNSGYDYALPPIIMQAIFNTVIQGKDRMKKLEVTSTQP